MRLSQKRREVKGMMTIEQMDARMKRRKRRLKT